MTSIDMVCTTSRRLLTDDEIAGFHEDGFVIMRGLFSAEELRPLQVGLPGAGVRGFGLGGGPSGRLWPCSSLFSTSCAGGASCEGCVEVLW